jgi:hypothetical protein
LVTNAPTNAEGLPPSLPLQNESAAHNARSGAAAPSTCAPKSVKLADSDSTESSTTPVG